MSLHDPRVVVVVAVVVVAVVVSRRGVSVPRAIRMLRRARLFVVAVGMPRRLRVAAAIPLFGRSNSGSDEEKNHHSSSYFQESISHGVLLFVLNFAKLDGGAWRRVYIGKVNS